VRPYIESYITVSPHKEYRTQKAVKSGGADEMDNIQKLVYDHNKFAIEKRTIMICEDEPDVLLSFEQMLKSEFNIISVDSGMDENAANAPDNA
jgi:hypothetical protein